MENVMHWEKLLSSKRFGNELYRDTHSHDRSEFQRDYDRLIFSAPFRRLQNKTQVFPLPGSVFVHNRLTHSLEVASVGRSLGLAVSKALRSKQGLENSDMLTEMGDIVSAACLAHDLGNPPFGHSGEKAIASFFSEGENHAWKSRLSETEWMDFCRFEGNANAFRLLTHTFNGRRPGGFVLTYSTLASMVKYPYPSVLADLKHSKFGFFTSETQSFVRIARELEMLEDPNQPLRFARHPLVYLVEAADDICYLIMDLEDAHKLKLIGNEETIALLSGFFEPERLKRIEETLGMVQDINEQIAYLRSCVIGRLIHVCAAVFVENEESILAGRFQGSLIKRIDPLAKEAYAALSKVSVSRIYRSSDVLDVELGGYSIITTLLEEFIKAALNPERAYSQLLLNRIPAQYEIQSESLYGRIQAILDYISGMTDVYALDLYQKMNGSSLPKV
jgi:dGTPase